MIFALLTLTLGSLQVPSHTQVPAAIQHATVPASVQVSETHFFAQSHAPEAQWIIFENRRSGLHTLRGLAPFGNLLYPIATGGAEGMTIEILSVDEFGTRCSSGVFSCASIKGVTLFVEQRSTGSVAWIPRHGGRSLTRVKPTGPSSASHVPVPLPSENKTKNKSRRIEKKKLPAI